MTIVKGVPLRDRFTHLRRSPVLLASGSVLGGQALMAVYGVLTARLLGPAGKGVVTSVITWTQLLAWGSVAGLGTAMSVEVARFAERDAGSDAVRKSLANAVVVAVVLGGAITCLAALVLPPLLSNLGADSRTSTILAVLTVPVQILTALTLMIQLGLGRTRLYGVTQIANPVVMTVVTVAFWLTTSHLHPQDVVISAMAGSAASFVASARGLPWRRMRVDVAMLRRDASFGGKLHLGSVLRLTNLRLDYLIMSTALPAVEIGLYSAANSAMVPIATVPAVAATLLSPAIAALAEDGPPHEAHAKQVELIRRKAERYTVYALLGGAMIALASPLLVPVLLGDSFRGSVRLVWILTPGYVALCFNNIVSAGTAGMKRPWIGTVAEGIAVVATVLLLPILLPPFGAEGAAAASTLAYTVSAVVAGVGFARVRRRGVTSDDDDDSLVAAIYDGIPASGQPGEGV